MQPAAGAVGAPPQRTVESTVRSSSFAMYPEKIWALGSSS